MQVGTGQTREDPVLDIHAVAEARPPEEDVDTRIREADAAFRRNFANRLYLLFFTAVVVGPIMVGGATITQYVLYPDKTFFPDVLEKATLLATSVLGTVAGVFGTVMGFYYGSEKK